MGEILCGRGGRVHEGRIMAAGRSEGDSNEAHIDRFGRKAIERVRSLHDRSWL